MLAFLRYLLRNAQTNYWTGALPDTRPPVEKKEDVHFSEIVANANVVKWEEKYPDRIRKFPELNQYQSSTCGANALAKAMGIMFFTKFGTYLAFARAHIYKRRVNRPYPGMALYDMFDIGNQGVTLEQLIPSTLYTDEDHDKTVIAPWMQKEGETWKVSKGIYLPADIETIASTIQTTGKGVILCTWFLAGEWSKTVPYIVENDLDWDDKRSLRHFVVAVDFTLYKGVKYLVIEDSAHFGGVSRRLVSEDWVKNRVRAAAYPMNFTFQVGTSTNRPIYDGLTIVSAQECLRYEGLFPSNISLVENVGPVTRKAIGDFQIKYGIPVTQALDQKTQSQLHILYP